MLTPSTKGRWIWRVDGAPQPSIPDGWGEGVLRHLRYQALTHVWVRRDGVTRCYLVLEGCPRCRPDGCDGVCHRALFTHLVQSTLPGVTLAPAPRLVADPGEQRLVVARPVGARAAPLTTTFLDAWPAFRCVTTWSCSTARGRPLVVGARLTVSTEGPPPTPLLREAGWLVDSVATLLSRRARQSPTITAVPARASAGPALQAALCDPRQLFGLAGMADEAPGVGLAAEPVEAVAAHGA
ncbi:MAG: hypothetical protein HGA45_07620 [Chloroflexales bacterium]|nr:hypothetical protein [Chloroflexales bacterium]